MKMTSALLALAALLVADWAVAAGAVVTSVTGTASVQTGTAAPRTLRQGDDVSQGDTVTTGARSTAVLRFEDGQVAALSPNSRLTVTTYHYNAQARSGNVLLSLISGGMRAITGLIGRNDPERVSYRAARATIGVRGTDTTVAIGDGAIVITVSDGTVEVTFEGRTFSITAGQGTVLRPNTPAVVRAAEEVVRQLPPGIAEAVGGLQGIIDAINQAAGGPPGGLPPGPPPGLPPGPPSFTPPGGGGGGAPSKS